MDVLKGLWLLGIFVFLAWGWYYCFKQSMKMQAAGRSWDAALGLIKYLESCQIKILVPDSRENPAYEIQTLLDNLNRQHPVDLDLTIMNESSGVVIGHAGTAKKATTVS